MTPMLNATSVARGLAVALFAALALAGCGRSSDAPVRGLNLPDTQVNTLGVNAYIWRAALETLGFMPMAQVDSNGGVILTDWYVNPQLASERVKVSVYVLDTDLRADALKINAQRQEARSGVWVDVPVRAGTVQKLEDAILSRARLLRQGSIR